MRVLIVDDEPLARARLESLMASHANVQVIGSLGDGDAAVEACQRLRPDVVLLDVEMPGRPGTAVAAELGRLADPPQVIFCTAYEQHAVSAFDVGATDYLLKPVRQERLAAALERAMTRRAPASVPAPAPVWLLARSGAEQLRIPLDDVLLLVADEKYVEVHHTQGVRLIDDSLRQLESSLGDRVVRLHRNCLVPRQRLLGLATLPDGRVLARVDGTHQAPEVSRRNLPAVRQLLRGG